MQNEADPSTGAVYKGQDITLSESMDTSGLVTLNPTIAEDSMEVDFTPGFLHSERSPSLSSGNCTGKVRQ
ncbi:Protein of unknown function [Gryllus bimaculatus]|nr:Protein of unknown function [Gryllus bimaculatus]